MKYVIYIEEGYITAIGTGSSGTEITEEEYNNILNIIRNKPPRTDTTDYRLKEDLTWEPYDAGPIPDPEPTDADYAEIGRILMGVES